MKKSVAIAMLVNKKQKDTKYNPNFPTNENANSTMYKTIYSITALEIAPKKERKNELKV